MDEVFGAENFVAVINFKTMMPLESGDIESVVDYLCWYARDKERVKYRNLFAPKNVGADSEFVFADTEDGKYRRLTREEIAEFSETAGKLRIFNNVVNWSGRLSGNRPAVFRSKTSRFVSGFAMSY